jgi:hypothetical protein
VDIAGPFFVREKVKGKGKRSPMPTDKVYVLLSVCCSTRAVSYEVVSSMETDDILMALRRLAARYGEPQLIRSDNAKYFIKAAKCVNVKWTFQPPVSPWWGGFFEVFVRLLKTPMRKIIKTALVTRTEFDTIVKEIEAVVNGRPLVQGEDGTVLTPRMLLGQDIFEQAENEAELKTDKECSKRMKYLQRISRTLRARWTNEYLIGLTKRDKRFWDKGNIDVGQLAFLVQDRPRAEWPLVKILETMTGPDGIVRVVKILYNGKELLRPVQKLIPLEI